jgi:hypothetical protein
MGGIPAGLERRMKRKLLVRCGERWGEIHRCKAAGTPSFDAMALWGIPGVFPCGPQLTGSVRLQTAKQGQE